MVNRLTQWGLFLERPIFSQSLRNPQYFMNQNLHYYAHKSSDCSVFWARWIQSPSSNRISLTSILILSYHLRSGFSSGLFLSCFSSNLSMHFSLILSTCSVHLFLLNFIILKVFPDEFKLCWQWQVRRRGKWGSVNSITVRRRWTETNWQIMFGSGCWRGDNSGSKLRQTLQYTHT